jgi:hypothetical protein
LVFVVAASPVVFDTAFAEKLNQSFGHDITETYFLRGDLTAPAGEAPFGGVIVGDYFIRVNDNHINILTEFDSNPSENMVYEGWLVDTATGYKLSTGQFDATNGLFFSQTIVNPWIYDVLVITEEPIEDTDPAPNTPVGGVLLEQPFGTA